MGSSYFNNCSKSFDKNLNCRNNHIDVWTDLFNYSANLNGNWMISKQIFYDYILPTAEEDPVQFAKWIRKMVKQSGLKIKSRSEFINSIKSLRNIKNNKDPNELKRILYYLLDSGLEEPIYAFNALNNNSA